MMQTEISQGGVSADTRRRIGRHIASLGSPDPKTSYGAERRLMRFGTRAVPQLLPLVSDDSPQVRFRVAWILGKTKDPRAYPALIVLTEDAEGAIQYDATMALGELGDLRAVPFLKELARRVPREDGRASAAMTALMKLGAHPSIEDFVQGIGVMEMEAADAEWTWFFKEYWHEELADSREDIYTLEDGQPLDAPRSPNSTDTRPRSA